MEDVLDEVVRLETAVWQALVEGDRDADERLLADDFLGVYPTGFGGRGAHVDQLAAGPTVATFDLSDIRALEVGDDAMLIVYRAEFVRTRVGDASTSMPESMYVSSLWCRRDDRWVNVFSQDTPDTGVAVV
jgi:hypothetical protein